MHAWERVQEGRGPEVVTILGESGLGKTRLIQEAYAAIAAQARSDADEGYWPRRLTEEGNDLRINPALADVQPQHVMPFMWWAIRVPNPHERNVTLSSTTATYVDILRAHAAAILRAGEAIQARNAALRNTALGAAKFIPVVGQILDLAEHGQLAWELVSGLHTEATLARRAPRSLVDEEDERRATLADEVANVFRTLLTDTARRDAVPTVWIIDDAQFSEHDPGVGRLLASILRQAHAERWPLLVLVTHWEREWNTDARDPDTVAHAITTEHAPLRPTWAPLRLRVVAPRALAPMLLDGLPGLTEAQVDAVLLRAAGQPLFLQELVRLAKRKTIWFEGNDPTRALTARGLEAMSSVGTRAMDVVEERLISAEPAVRSFVMLSSLQGPRHSLRITRELAHGIADHLRAAHHDHALDDDRVATSAHRPYAFIEMTDGSTAAYAQRLFFEAARRHADDTIDTDLALATLRTIVHEHVTAGPQHHSPEEWALLLGLAVDLLEHADEARHRTSAAVALAATARRAAQAHEPMLAAQAAERFHAGVRDQRWPARAVPFADLRALATVLTQAHKFDEALDLARALPTLAANGDDLATAAESLGDALHGKGRHDEAGQAWTRALRLRTEAHARVESNAGNAGDAGDAAEASREALAWAHDRVATWHATQERHDQAVEHHRSMLQACQATFDARPTPHSERNLGVALERLADAEVDAGLLDDALASYRRVVDIRRHLHATQGTTASEEELLTVLSRIARIHQRQGRLDEARSEFQEILEAQSSLIDRRRTPDAERNQSITLGRLAALHQEEGEYDEALALLTRALAMRERLHARLATPETERDLAITLGRIGGVHRKMGDVDAAAQAYEQALAHMDTLDTLLGTPRSAADLSVSLGRLADVADTRGDLALASDLLARRVQIDERIEAATHTVAAQRQLARTLHTVAGLLQRRGETIAALEHLARAQTIDRRLASQQSDDAAKGSRDSVATRMFRVGQRLRGDG